eukprot:403351958
MNQLRNTNDDISKIILNYKQQGFLQYVKSTIILVSFCTLYSFFNQTFVEAILIQMLNVLVYYLNKNKGKAYYNAIVIFYWFTMVVLTGKVHVDNLKQKDEFFVNQFNSCSCLFMLFLSRCVDLSWKRTSFLFFVSKLYDLLTISQAIGFNKIPNFSYLAYLIEIIIFLKAVKFQDEILTELKNAITETKDAELDLRMLVKLLPEGVMILNTETRSIQLINRIAIKFFKPQDELDPKLLDLRNLGRTPCPATHHYYEQMRTEVNDIIKTVDIRETTSKANLERCGKSPIVDLHSFLFYKSQSTINLSGQFKILGNKQQIDYQIVNFNRKHQVLVLLQDLHKVREEEKSVVQTRMQTLYFASVAHDLRTPLNAMMSATQTLKVSNLPSRYNEIIEMQEMSGKFLMNLVEDILDLSRFEFNKFELNNSRFDIRLLIDEAFMMIRHRAEAKKIQTVKIIGDSVPLLILADKKRVNQVLINLLTNALKFTKKGQVVMRANKVDQIPRLENINIGRKVLQVGRDTEDLEHFDQKENAGYIQVQVIDTGIGISFENQKKLFKTFGKLKDTSGLNENGCGLGLTICKKISESMNGAMMLESFPGVGSTFTFYFQLQQDDNIINGSQDEASNELLIFEDIQSDQENLSDRIKSKQQHQYFKSFTTVNTMEALKKYDNSFNILALKLQLNMLIDGKVNFDQEFSGQDGIEMIIDVNKSNQQKQNFDLVFVDFNMPQMDGISMMKQLKEIEKRGQINLQNTQFILWSAQTEDQVNSYKEYGFKMFLEKPIDAQQLRNVIQKAGIPINNTLNFNGVSPVNRKNQQ